MMGKYKTKRDIVQRWQKVLSEGLSNSRDLLNYLGVAPEGESELAEQQFAVRVPLGFVKKMKPNDPRDPLLLQVLATQKEMNLDPQFSFDPLKERDFNPVPGLIHKYSNRVLITLTGACAINCRYCFRRHFPYEDNVVSPKHWYALLDYIEADHTISEVIFSGGDPLLASDKTWKAFLDNLSDMAHIKTIRIHSRIPTVLPERVTDEWIDITRSTGRQLVMVLHSNHPNELCEEVASLMQRLREHDFMLLNQSVLLKDINDSAETLSELSTSLFSIGVLPYYLHLLDKVQGAAHFAVEIHRAKDIHQSLMSLLPGYLVPKLVMEEPKAYSKTWINK